MIFVALAIVFALLMLIKEHMYYLHEEKMAVLKNSATSEWVVKGGYDAEDNN